jgi:hypothetical protein
LAFEPLEQRGMMAAVVGALPVACEMQSEDAMALPEGVSLLLIGPDVSIEGLIAEGGDDQVDGSLPEDWLRCGTDLILQNASNKILAEYHEFVAQNPTWPEQHGAGGIQLMVLTPSRLLRGVVLSTPGEALSFDAWLQEIRGFPIGPVFGDSPNATSTASDPTPSADASGLSYRDAAWASLFSTTSAAEPTNATPAGGRRRGR